LQPLAPNNGANVARKQLVATIPIANGGTRKKHHYPWTIHEVMTLVEGVADCGAGKWTNIKKLAFSSIGYKATIDLNVDFSPRRLTFLHSSFFSVFFTIFFLLKFDVMVT
jgi:hypothetical protein